LDALLVVPVLRLAVVPVVVVPVVPVVPVPVVVPPLAHIWAWALEAHRKNIVPHAARASTRRRFW